LGADEGSKGTWTFLSDTSSVLDRTGDPDRISIEFEVKRNHAPTTRVEYDHYCWNEML
jgi:hypothetical protein